MKRLKRLVPLAISYSLLAGLPLSSQSVSTASGSAQGIGFSFKFNPSSFQGYKVIQEPRLTMEENGSDIPDGISPARIKFSLKSIIPDFIKDKTNWHPNDALIQIIPLVDSSVPNFKKAYPDFTEVSSKLAVILKHGKLNPIISTDLPCFDQGDCIQTIHAKSEIIDTNWCSGIQYLTTCVQEAAEIDNDRLVYRFEGISKDSKFYISVEIPIGHPSLPFSAPNIASVPERAANTYYLQAEQKLNRIPDDSFTPSISSLRILVRSINP